MWRYSYPLWLLHPHYTFGININGYDYSKTNRCFRQKNKFDSPVVDYVWIISTVGELIQLYEEIRSRANILNASCRSVRHKLFSDLSKDYKLALKCTTL